MAIVVDTVRRFYDALGRDDVPAVLSLCADRRLPLPTSGQCAATS